MVQLVGGATYLGDPGGPQGNGLCSGLWLVTLEASVTCVDPRLLSLKDGSAKVTLRKSPLAPHAHLPTHLGQKQALQLKYHWCDE